MAESASKARHRASSEARVRAYLEERGFSDNVVTFDASTRTAQMAADVIGCELGQIVKSLVFVGHEGRAALALVAGDRRGDPEAIVRETGLGGIRMANGNEVRAATGYAIGGVCPFDLPEELPVLVDESLRRFNTVYPAAGTPNSAVPLSLEDLLRLSHGRFAAVSQ